VRTPFPAGVLFSAACLLCRTGTAQQEADVVTDPPGVRLELTMEVATTTNDGLPAALRFTLVNIGSVPVDIPLPAIDCSGPNGSIRIHAEVHYDGPMSTGYGHGCGGGVTDGPSFLEKIRREWLRLRPGEYLTFLGDRRTMVDKANVPATYEIHAIYTPPALTPLERSIAAQNGFVVPAEAVESDSLSYHQK
jgi:hypothetical protein